MNRRYKLADWYIRPDLLEIARGSVSITLTETQMALLRLLLSKAPEPLSWHTVQANLPYWKNRSFADCQATLNQIQKTLDHEKSTPLWAFLPEKNIAILASVEVLPTASPARQPKWLQETDIPKPVPSVTVWPLVALAFALVLTVALVLAPLFNQGDSSVEIPGANASLSPGETGQSSLSPDKQYLAFSWPQKQDSSNIYVKDLSTDRVLKLTQSTGKDLSPAWAPDGSKLAFIRQADAENSLRIFSVNTFEETALLPLSQNPGTGLSWSPDGQLLAFSDRHTLANSPAIMALELDTLQIQQLTFPSGENAEDILPRFSPTGKQMAFFRKKSGGPSVLMVRQESETEPHAIFTEGGNPVDLRWLSESLLMYAIERNHRFDYRRMDLTTKVNQPVPSWDQPGILPKFRSSEAEPPTQNSDVLTMPLPSKPDPKQQNSEPQILFASEQAEMSPSYSPDGTRLAFSSGDGHASQLMISDLQKLETLPLLTPGLLCVDQPVWSPDGQTLAFHAKANRFGPTQIYLFSLVDGKVQKFSPDPKEESHPKWSADGSALYFVSGTQKQLMRRHVSDGTTQFLGLSGVLCASENSAGTQILFTFTSDDTTLWQTDLQGKALTPLFTRPSFQPSNWSVTAKGVYYAANHPDGASIYFHKWNSTQSTLVQSLPFRLVPFGFTVAKDGHALGMAKDSSHPSEGQPLPMR